ncbi:hypothetical protein FG05_35434 [Fusarium graminearum]|nr:hypothetical protein FG05_35434 [Fusarium graminearum]
MFLFDPILAKG